jgi:hypothetical protein
VEVESPVAAATSEMDIPGVSVMVTSRRYDFKSA